MIFIEGLLFGMMWQIVGIGPVCVAVFNKSISKGFSEAFKMSWGVAVVDLFYILLSIIGMSAIFKIDIIRWIVLGISSITLIYIGIRHIIPSYKIKSGKSKIEDGNSFIYGIKLTLPNAITIVVWANAFGQLMASHKLIGIINTLVFSLGCALSTVVFFILVSFLGNWCSRIFDKKAKQGLNVFVGLFLIYFAIRTLVINWR